jgi:type I restriction enzyme R subunit
MRNERETQNRVINLLKEELGYNYLGSFEDRDGNSNIEEEFLVEFLKNKYSDALIKKAIVTLKKTAVLSANEDLYGPNKAVYSLLRYGIKEKEETGENSITINLIDWKNPENNNFYVAEEVTILGEKVKRPDIVLYVNGIALGVLELKRASVSVTEGIRQNLDNQQQRFIKPFFTTMQLVLAGSDSQGLYYGTTKTDEKYYLKWKEDNYDYKPGVNILDEHIRQFCNKERLLDLIHNFIVFDGGWKKLCRPNQYFGIKEAQKYIGRKEGGIIWHTQGSGKSLTMVWLAKWIRENIDDARLLIITDRTELDDQIEKVFKGVDEDIYKTKSGNDLINKLNVTSPWLLCTILHKFGGKDETTEFIEDLKIPQDFKAKGNLFVFVDECHRSNSGELHDAMKNILPDETVFIGFTGTPLLKKDKKKSIEIFGEYIHTYKFNEAVKDGVVLDLLYEARDVDQRVLDQKGLDEWFDAVTVGMNDSPKTELKQKWGNMQKVLSSKDRLQKIAFDIFKDFKTKARLKNGKGNAILVANSIYEACRYYEIFQSIGFKKCAIITSFEPNAQSTKGETTGSGDTQKVEQFEIYQKMLNGKDHETFEKEAKKQFIEEPANMQLLIVRDKLLTGFDAPSCTYLYIDKKMQDHSLFQAICRVNRTEKEDKEFGYIVDYQDLFDSLNKSILDYTSDAFDDYDKDDVKGLLNNRLEKAKERLEDDLETLHQLCADVKQPKQVEEYIEFFCGNTEVKEHLKLTEELRLTFYKAAVQLIRSYNNIAGEMKEAGYTIEQAEKIKLDVDHYVELRNVIKNASGEYIDLKSYEPEMRQLLDMYLTADPSRTISNFGDATLLQLIVEQGIDSATEKLPHAIRKSPRAMAETIEANMRKVIIQETPINPAYYEKMSTLLTELVNQRKLNAISYEEFLKKIEELAKNVQPKAQKSNYPKSIDNRAKQAFYDNLDEDEQLANDLYTRIDEDRPADWKGNRIKEKLVRNVVEEVLEEYNRELPKDADLVIDIAKNQSEFD